MKLIKQAKTNHDPAELFRQRYGKIFRDDSGTILQAMKTGELLDVRVVDGVGMINGKLVPGC